MHARGADWPGGGGVRAEGLGRGGREQSRLRRGRAGASEKWRIATEQHYANFNKFSCEYNLT